MQFKSGTDVRGIAAEGVVGENVNLTDFAVKRITESFALWLCRKLNSKPENIKISVGHDSRISAQRIKKAVTETLCECGFTVLSCGLSSTPAMFMTTVDLGCDAAIQITASHHPFNRNGLKFFTRTGGLEGSEIAEILSLAEGEETLPVSCGNITEVDYMSDYSANLREMIKKGVNSDDYDLPLKGYKIVVDAGNGAGGFYAEKVLKPLGADINGSQFLEPDGMFPNHIPNPENEKAMDSARQAVLSVGADLGIVFDTDVDRAAVVDSRGGEINRNRLIALAACIALENSSGATVVTDSVTSDGLTYFINKILGGKHHRFKRGYKNVIDEAIALNEKGIDCPLAIETSGHAALRENYFLDDGAYLVTKIIITVARLGRVGKTIDMLLSELPEPAESVEYRIALPHDSFKTVGANVLNSLMDFTQNHEGWSLAPNNYEGVRINVDKNFGDGWLLLRMSVHDPVMPLNIESNIEGGCDKIAAEFKKFLSKFENLKI